MKKVIYTVLMLAFVGQTFAQVQFGLSSDEPKKIQMSITSVSNYATPPFNQFSNSNFTIRWPDSLTPTPTFSLANSSTIVYQLDGTPTNGGDGFIYQKVSTFAVNILSINMAEEIEVVELTVIGDYSSMELAETFEIADNANGWVIANNGQSSMENFMGEQWNGYTSANSSVILPINVSTFEAAKKDRSVKLDWTTSSESNGSHFEIERSQDLEQWSTIGTVEAVGESNTTQTYAFVDNKLPLSARSFHKTFYYRLKMVDLDGQTENSEIRSVRFDLDGEGDFIVYPNPSINEVYVNLSSISTESGPATMNIVNANGQLVKKVMLNTSDDIRVDISDMAPGVYYFLADQNGKSFSQKVIKID